MVEWIISGASLLLVNIFAWVFFLGRGLGKTNTRLNQMEKRLNSQEILPECSQIFTEIKEKLSGLEGKVDILILTIKENQRNKEKEHTEGKSEAIEDE